MEELLKMYREYNDKRFDEVRADLQEVNRKLDEIHDFKVTTIATSRTVSMIVSALCGLLTLITSAAITINFK